MMLQRINRKNDLISEAEVHLVFVNNLGKPTRIPEQLIESFKPFIKN